MNAIQGNAASATAPAQIAPPLEAEVKPAPATPAPAPILITEKHVLFSTSAAVAVRPATMHRSSKAAGVIRSVMHRMWLTSSTDNQTADSPEPHPHYPKRYEFLEQSCMSREMSRL